MMCEFENETPPKMVSKMVFFLPCFPQRGSGASLLERLLGQLVHVVVVVNQRTGQVIPLLSG